MPALSRIPLYKHTVKLFKGDFSRLGDHYPEIGASSALRQLLRTHLNKLDKGLDQDVLRVVEDV